MLRRIARVLRLTQFLALLLVIGMGAVLYTAMVQFEAASHWVEHTHDAIDQIEQVRLEAMRSGIWLRNFAVAANKDSLQRVRVSAAVATQAAKRLDSLTADNPAQSHRIQQLQSELTEVMGQYLSLATIAERDGAAALGPLVNARVARDSTQELRQLLDEAERVERDLLHARSHTQHQRFAFFKKLLAGCGIVFAAIMLWAIRYSSRLLRLGQEQVHALQSKALRDPLTGLLNRRGLRQQLAVVAQQPRVPDQHVAVLAFDLDDFKPVNDRHGHAAGDQVLQEVARRLLHACRDSDTVARVGGDEFIVVLPVVRSREEAETIAWRTRQQLMRPISLDTGVVRVGASIGLALLHEDGNDMDTLLQAADAQMYEAKKDSKPDGAGSCRFRMAAPIPA